MPGLGSKIDTLWELREKKRVLEREIKEIDNDMRSLSDELLDHMGQEDVMRATGSQATASVSELTYPSVEDWDKFYAFLHRNKFYHLLERRPSVTGCRELFETKGVIPGVVPYVKRRINLRTL